MVYTSDESGQSEIYVCSFPDIDQKRVKISTSGGQEPRWSPDGRELFYRSENSMMVVKIETDPNFDASAPTTLFEDIYYSYIGHQWDIHPNGEQFLMIKESFSDAAEAIPRERINIVLNWFEELKDRVPLD
jgi:Tol biopolymer transport system component